MIPCDSAGSQGGWIEYSIDGLEYDTSVIIAPAPITVIIAKTLIFCKSVRLETGELDI